MTVLPLRTMAVADMSCTLFACSVQELTQVRAKPTMVLNIQFVYFWPGHGQCSIDSQG